MISRQQFCDGGYWGLSAAVDLHSCDPALIRSAGSIREFVYKLCDHIGVQRYGECVIVHFGEREEIAGFSMTQLIETSLVSGHFVNQTNRAFLDVFSCNYFDSASVAEQARAFFGATSVTLNCLLRR
jgi:S-adenosylmethionine/arginine decarboxylase-like enzyme